MKESFDQQEGFDASKESSDQQECFDVTNEDFDQQECFDGTNGSLDQQESFLDAAREGLDAGLSGTNESVDDTYGTFDTQAGLPGVNHMGDNVDEGVLPDLPYPPLIRPLLGCFLSIFADFSDFLGRLQPSKTTIQRTPNTLGVEESSSPRRVLHF